MKEGQLFIRVISRLIGLFCALGVFALSMAIPFIWGVKNGPYAISVGEIKWQSIPVDSVAAALIPLWKAPDLSSIPDTEEGKLNHYGRDLIAHSSVYLGPTGKVESISNGLNCQKSDAGSREMKAMISYLKWVGKGVDKEESLGGYGLLPLRKNNKSMGHFQL